MKCRLLRVTPAVFAFLLTACAGQQEIPPGSLDSLPLSHLIVGLPFHRQVEDQCGPASLATVLAARDIDVEPESLRGKLYIPGKKGAVTTEMVARARRFGLLVYPLRPELGDIIREVAADNPVLVLQNLGFDWMPRWHFSVVIGFDRDKETLVLRSGNESQREIGFMLFLRTWSRAQRWGVVVMRPRALPATAERDSFIAAASELERVGENQAALGAYTAAAVHWPENEMALMGAGNSAYATGQFELAGSFFSQLVEAYPSSAAGWNNLAHGLMQMGCRSASLSAIDCALRLDSANAVYRDSRKELSASSLIAKPSSDCTLPRCPVP